MNLPNKITLTRICMIPVFATVFYLTVIPCNYLIAAVIFAFAAFTDFLDGYLARSMHLVTNLGKFLDPIADKVLVSTAFILLLTRPVAFTVEPFGDWGLLIAGVCISVILGRELIVSGFRMVAAGQHVVLAADKLGKLKTCAQDAAVAVLIACMPFLSEPLGKVAAYIGLAFFFLCTLLTIASGLNYIIRNGDVLKDKPQKTEEE